LLTVLDYLLHAGSEHVVMYFRDNIYVIKTLKEFQYIDERERTRALMFDKRRRISPISCKTRVDYARNAVIARACAIA
jgi:hypothetical protein